MAEHCRAVEYASVAIYERIGGTVDIPACLKIAGISTVPIFIKTAHSPGAWRVCCARNSTANHVDRAGPHHLSARVCVT